MAKKNTKTEIVVMDFSGIYEQEQFHTEAKSTWVEVRELPGTNCYCDGEAFSVLREKIREFPIKGIHYIDSGNYHYMSRIWLEKIEEPFRLLVFDNHTDMQPPAFGGLLSCGGWIAAALEELPLLQEVILVGPDEEAYAQVEPEFRKRVRFLSREHLKENTPEENREFFQRLPNDLPLYISVDKDVLCPRDACTTWSQGDMTLEELLSNLQVVQNSVGEKWLGVDICGECDPDQPGDSGKNDLANRALLKFFADRIDGTAGADRSKIDDEK